jgi:hypothetical protein
MQGSIRKSVPSKKQLPLEGFEEEHVISSSSSQSTSVVDEIRKLAKLREEGLLTEKEFQQMKQDLIRKNNFEG